MGRKKTYKEIETLIEKIIEKNFGDLKTVPGKLPKDIYGQTLAGQRMDKKIAIHNGRDEKPEIKDATTTNLKKIRKKRGKYFFFVDMRGDEYFVGGKKLDLGKMEATLLYYFLKDQPPLRTTAKEIYIGVWKEGNPSLPIKDNYKKSIEDLLVRLRKKVELATKKKGTDIVKCWTSPRRGESVFGVNPDLNYCVIFD